jgi:hypothetical protein
MVNINLTPSTAKELTAMIEVLEKKGLIASGQTTAAKVEVVNPTPAPTMQPFEQYNPIPTMMNTSPVNVQPVPQTGVNPVTGQPVPMQPVNVQPVPAAVPTTTKAYSQDELATAAVKGLMDTGRVGELQQLMGQFGIQALPQLPKEQYGAFATALRMKGCQI